MPRNPSSTTHRGWAWDNDDQRLEVVVNGVEIGGFDSDGFSISGRGTVIQQTDKTTGVTINNRAGTITMDNADITAGSEVGFVVTNSVVGVNDVIIVSIGAAAATASAYTTTVNEVADGSFVITISNATGGTLSEAILLNFVVIKVAA